MPKVIHVVRKFEPAEWGGTETHLIAMIRELRALGWSSEVHAPAEDGTDGAPILDAGASFRTFRARYPYLRMGPEQRAALVAAGGNLVSFDELTSLLVRPKPAVIHLHTLGRLGGVIRAACRLRRIPYAVTMHGPVRAHAHVAEQDAQRRTKGLIDVGAPFGVLVGARRVVHDADLVYVLNQAEYDGWAQSRQGKHLEIVSHGVSLEKATHANRAAARQSISGLGQAPFVVLIGRLDRAKGQDLALSAFAAAAPPNMHVVFAGSESDASFAREVRAQAEGLGDRAHVIGGVSPVTARALLAGATLALVPSRSEPFGIVLLEAWAEGIPTLFSDVGGLGDIARRTGGTWGLVKADDAHALGEKMRIALSSPEELDAERREVRERVGRHYSWRSLAERIVEGYARSVREPLPP